jgi:hypothetical protein
MRVRKCSGSGKEPLAREEWDFSTIPTEELTACFLYEYARESRTIRAIAQRMEGVQYTDFSDQLEPNFVVLRRHNYRCAILLANTAPDLKLAAIPWQALGERRAVLRECVQNVSSVRKVDFLDVKFWEDCRLRNPGKIGGLGFETVSLRIDWTKPLRQIERDALDWLRANSRCKGSKGKRGRHAKEQAECKDALRRIGALRLWARYPLKKAMRITENCGVHLYSTYLDNGRPANQTAWENGVKGVAKLLQKTFLLDETEIPLSWQQLTERRKQK